MPTARLESAPREPGRIAAALRSKTAGHALLLFAGANFFYVSAFLIYAALGRLLTVRAFGDFVSLLAFVNIGGVIPGLGQAIATRVSAEATARGGPSVLAPISRAFIRPAVAIGLLIAVAVIAASEPLTAFFHLEQRGAVILAGVLMGVSVLLPVQRGILQGAQRFAEYAASQALEGLLKLLLSTAFAFAGLATAGAYAGYALGAIVVAGWNGWTIRRCFGAASADVPLPWRELLHGAGSTALAIFIVESLAFYDVLIVKHAFPPTEAGIYASAAVVGRVLLAVIAFLPPFILSKVTNASAKTERTFSLLLGAIGATLVPVIALFAVVVGAPGFVLRTVTGPAFLAAGQLLLPLALSAVALAFSNVLVTYLVGRKRLAFTLPLAALAVLTVATVALWHPAVLVVAWTVATGNAIVFATLVAATLLSEFDGRRHRTGAAPGTGE